jgi:hypothetical protein
MSNNQQPSQQQSQPTAPQPLAIPLNSSVTLLLVIFWTCSG